MWLFNILEPNQESYQIECFSVLINQGYPFKWVATVYSLLKLAQQTPISL